MTGRGKKAATTAAPKKKAKGYRMPAPIPQGEVIHDTLMKKKWRIGPSIGVGGFGEIYSACEHENSPKKGSTYPYVVKIEPHENGPLFVEKNFYIRNSNKDEITKFMKTKKLSNLGMPLFFGNGSHDFNGEKYRYLVLERYGKDVWSLFQDAGRLFSTATVFQLGLQMLDVIEYIHSRGYVHADIKGANILMGLKKGSENQAYLLDFGLATRVNEKDFKPDPKCAHNGTIEYTSRDAHLGVATMRGDLEILGYNMLQWIIGELPWEKSLKQPKTVQAMKEDFLKNVRTRITKDYPNVPDALIKLFEYINTMKPKDIPDYAKCQTLFQNYLKSEGKSRSSKIDFTSNKMTKTKRDDSVDVPKRRGRKPKVPEPEGDDENAQPESDDENENKRNGNIPKPARGRKPKIVIESEEDEPTDEETLTKTKKRKSTEPDVLTKLKKSKLTAIATPPAKKNHANIATQTSTEKSRRSPRNEKKGVSFDSPICEILGSTKSSKNSDVNSSGDIFDDSFVIEEKKVKPKRKLLSNEQLTVKKVVRKKTTTVLKAKGKSWKDCPTIINGRLP